ncbi:unnamed protein product [Cylicocyclus nassatus]|uniref:Transmembrane protein 135 N-terminal domain-containing protein n=1 Tax=Cylicocyclus nassatus TaxID=53992 RepID=A0AA36HE97_CYLNA|nr:unnamed protein product [Cylicocyclus nassatus]
MAFLSKLAYALDMQILTTNCYETIHTWEPDCYKAILVATPNGFWVSLRTYLTFYTLTTLISKRGDVRKVDWKRFFVDVMRSSIFLTANLLLFQYFICRARHLLGFFTVPTMGCLTSMMASLCAILIEKNSRRPALALYTTNLASETLYRQLRNHGYLFSVKYGECVPFAVGLGIFMYLRARGNLDPTVKKVLNFSHCAAPDEDIVNASKLPDDFHAMLDKLRHGFGRTSKCEHKYSCASAATESFAKNFAIGAGISAILALLRNLRHLFANPLTIAKVLLSKENLKLPLFFGLLPLLFHVTRCATNRLGGSSTEFSNAAAGVVSAASMALYPNVTIAMYTLWKAIEAVYCNAVEAGYLPVIPHWDTILYTISTGYVLWQTVVEPQAVRKGYLGFLKQITGDRFRLFNRDLYEHFGFQSKLLYPDVKLVLNTKYVTLNPMLYQKIRPPC